MARPERDVFGHCINCGKNMLVDEYVDGRIQRRFTADKDEVTYLLDDGSRMRVSTCRKCKEQLDGSPEELDAVMKIVIRGWQHEIETYVDWDQVKKDDYIKRYSQLKIVVRSDNKQDDVVKRIEKEWKKENGGKKDKKIIDVPIELDKEIKSSKKTKIEG